MEGQRYDRRTAHEHSTDRQGPEAGRTTRNGKGAMIISTDLNERRDEMRRLLSKIMEERVEIAFASELGVVVDSNVAGFASPVLSSLIREATPDEFRGHCAGMLVCDEHLRRLDPIAAGIVFDSLAIHEAAHLATGCHVPVDVPTNGLVELIQTPPATWPEYANKPKWATHDARFIRALCHIHHRFESRRVRVILDQAFDYERYGLSSIEAYREALGGEPKTTSWLPLREVLSRPMPDDFCNLWGRDVVLSLGLKPA